MKEHLNNICYEINHNGTIIEKSFKNIINKLIDKNNNN